MPPIRGFIESTLIDWEGKLAAEVFLPGCNFRCHYCHARDLVEPIPTDEVIPLEAVLLYLRRQRGWIDGVVICGGEPTIHHDLRELISVLRAEGVGVKLDTNGSRPDVLRGLIDDGLVDYVAMDVKAPLDERYAETAGTEVDIDAIRESIEMLMSGPVPYEFRTTVCPAFLDTDDIVQIAETIRGARAYFLQPFRPVNCLDREMEKVEPYDPDYMRSLCEAAAPYVQRCAVRGDQTSEILASRAED